MEVTEHRFCRRLDPHGLAVVLALVGVKMLLLAADVHIPIWMSLAFILVVLVATALLSFKIPPTKAVPRKALPTDRSG